MSKSPIGEYDYYQTMFENIPIGIAIVNKQEQVLLMNQAMSKITGFANDEINDFRMTDYYYSKEDRVKIRNILEEKGEIDNLELRIYRKDRSIYWALITVRPIRFKGEMAFLVSHIDITEQKKIQKELEEKDLKIQESHIISMISTIFIHNTRTFHDKIQNSIKLFGNALKANYVTIIRCKNQPNLINLENGSYLIDAFWKKPNNFEFTIEEKKNLKDLLGKIVEDFSEDIPANFYKVIQPKCDLNSNKKIQKALIENNMNSLLLLPLFIPGREKSNRLYGVIIAIDEDVKREYKRSEIHIGIEMSIIFGLAIKNRINEDIFLDGFENLSRIKIGAFIHSVGTAGDFDHFEFNDYFKSKFDFDFSKLKSVDDFSVMLEEKDIEQLKTIISKRIQGVEVPNLFQMNFKTKEGIKSAYVLALLDDYRGEPAIFRYVFFIDRTTPPSLGEVARSLNG